MMKLKYAIIFLAGILSLSSCKITNKQSDELDNYKTELLESLENDIIKVWYPRVIDSLHGGYLSDFNYKWEMQGKQNKMIVTQSRHIWTSSTYAGFASETNDYFLQIANHGVKFLSDKMWDNVHGGFFNLVNREGRPIAAADGRIIKNAYGNAFAIYGLASYVYQTKDSLALALAKKAFYWLDKNSFDPVFGGYFQFLEADGTAIKNGYDGVPPKDQNSSIHLLEAFTELYKVWPEPIVKERLITILHFIRDKLVQPKGYLQLFVNEDLSPVSYRDSTEEKRKKNWHHDHISFGHDVETAYLMLEASEVAGIENDTATIRIAKKMVDHSLKNGWDKINGGFYEAGYYFKNSDSVTIINDSKNWWAQAEGLNTFLLMSQIYPNDKNNYLQMFDNQWKYIKSFLIDYEFGDWYPNGLDNNPESKMAMKSQIWKGNYHTSRSLMNCIKNLE